MIMRSYNYYNIINNIVSEGVIFGGLEYVQTGKCNIRL